MRTPKSDLYRELLCLVNSGRLELLDVPRLRTQLTGLERRTTSSGKDTIDHAPTGHDDLANSCAGVLVEVSRQAAQPLRVWGGVGDRDADESFAQMVTRRGSYFPGID